MIFSGENCEHSWPLVYSITVLCDVAYALMFNIHFALGTMLVKGYKDALGGSVPLKVSAVYSYNAELFSVSCIL